MKNTTKAESKWPELRTLRLDLSVHYPEHLEKLDFQYRQKFEFATKAMMTSSRKNVADAIWYFTNEIIHQVEKGKHRKQFKFLDEPVHKMKLIKVVPASENPEIWIPMENLK